MIKYMDDRLGFIDTISDESYVMDDYGNLQWVPFSIGAWYWQDSD